MPCAPSRVVYHIVWVAYSALRLCLVSGINRRTTPPLPCKRFVDALGYVWWLRLSFASLVARSPTLVIGLCDPWSKSTSPPSSWLFRAMSPELRAASSVASVFRTQAVCSSLLPARFFSSPPAPAASRVGCMPRPLASRALRILRTGSRRQRSLRRPADPVSFGVLTGRVEALRV